MEVGRVNEETERLPVHTEFVRTLNALILRLILKPVQTVHTPFYCPSVSFFPNKRFGVNGPNVMHLVFFFLSLLQMFVVFRNYFENKEKESFFCQQNWERIQEQIKHVLLFFCFYKMLYILLKILFITNNKIITILSIIMLLKQCTVAEVKIQCTV